MALHQKKKFEKHFNITIERINNSEYSIKDPTVIGLSEFAGVLGKSMIPFSFSDDGRIYITKDDLILFINDWKSRLEEVTL